MLGLFSSKNRLQERLPVISADAGTYYDKQRRSNRVEIEMLVTATTEDGRMYSGYTRDLSREGTRVMIHGDLEVGEPVVLKFRFTRDNEEISMPAIVRSAICERYGMEFCETETAYHDERIVSVCKQLVMGDFAYAGEMLGCS